MTSKKPGVIRDNELYTVDEVKRRLGVEIAAFRKMKRAGLKVIPFGRRHYVLGSSILKFFEGMQSNGNQDQAVEAR